MPAFTVTLHESNDCHSPAGSSAGGQFCGDGVSDFKTWFGKSKVVDANGNPKKMYHGTNADPKDFRAGSHFGTAEAANERAETLRDFSVNIVKRPPGQFQVIPVYLSIRNPLRMPDLASVDTFGNPLDDNGESTHPDGTPSSWEGEGNLMEQLNNMGIFRGDDFWDHQYASTEEILALLEERGYDGIVYKNDVEDRGQDSYIIFHPEQARLVFGVKL